MKHFAMGLAFPIAVGLSSPSFSKDQETFEQGTFSTRAEAAVPSAVAFRTAAVLAPRGESPKTLGDSIAPATNWRMDFQGELTNELLRETSEKFKSLPFSGPLKNDEIRSNFAGVPEKIPGGLSDTEIAYVRKQSDAMVREIIFERAHQDENAFSKLIQKKWEIVKTLEGEERFFAGLALLTVFYFFIFYPLGYIKTIRNIVTNHTPVDSKAFSLFATWSVLGSTNAFYEGAPVAGTGYLILAILGGLTVILNERTKRGIAKGTWSPKAGGVDSLINYLKDRKFFLKVDSSGKVLHGYETLEKLGISRDALDFSEAPAHRLFLDETEAASIDGIFHSYLQLGDQSPQKELFCTARGNGYKRDLNLSVVPVREGEKITGFYFIGDSLITGEASDMAGPDVLDDSKTRERVKTILYENALFEKNPMAIYDGATPLFWNHAMEYVSEYPFPEIRQFVAAGGNVSDLFYGYSEQEIDRVRDAVRSALTSGHGYEDRTFTLKSKSGNLVKIAWHTEPYGKTITIRKGSIDLAKKLQFMTDSGATIKDLMLELMRQKDEYTSGHISRVMDLSLVIADLYGYDLQSLERLKIMAGLHDFGKTQVNEAVLKKPGALNDEERKSMESHPWNGIYHGVQNGFGEYVRGMPHHADFYSQRGDMSLFFESLVEEIKQGADVDPLAFNRIVGNQIPEEARIVAVADVIDAIVSRRIYSGFLGSSIDDIVSFLRIELARSSGIVFTDGEPVLDEARWQPASETQMSLPYCIRWKDTAYVPTEYVIDNHPEMGRTEKPNRIQLDPFVVRAMYDGDDFSAAISEMIRRNDREIVPKKIQEVRQYIASFELRKSAEGDWWSEKDETNLARMNKALRSLKGMMPAE